MNIILFIALMLFNRSSAPADEQPQLPTEHYTRERSYHVAHYKITVALDEKTKTCVGEVNIKLIPLRPQFDLVRLDAADMTIKRVMLGNLPMDFQHTGETLSVNLNKMYGLHDTVNLTVAYSVASPKKGLYFMTPDSGYAKKQWQIWSNGETEENHFWFPCYDFPNDRATSEMVATVRDNWTVVSNGKLLEVTRDAKKHTATFHWFESKPHVSYLISLVAGEYVEVKDSWGNIPLSYYVYKFQKEDALRSFAKTPKVMEFYSSKIGYSYPWEKYSQTVVQDYIVGGQENVSATTLTDGTIHDSRAHLDVNSDDLVAHELAHQWFGDMITCRDWAHTWLNEGFASYFTILFQEIDRGKDVALKSVYDAQKSIVNSDFGDKRRPTSTGRFLNPGAIFDNRIYGKGACVLHMMRSILGDELFWKGINHYVNKFQFQCVETNDFKVAVEEATGYNLHWFFDEWVYKAGYPEFTVSTSWNNGNVLVNVKQTQAIDSLTGIFTMPLEIEVWVHGVPETYTVTVSKAEEEFSFPAYQQPQLVLFDKGSRLIKKVKFQKTTDEWIFQLQNATDGVDRIDAIDELRWVVDSANVIAALSKTAIEDPFTDVRREAVWAMGDAKKSDVTEVLIKAYGDRDAKVRGASMAALKNFTGEQVVKTLQHAFESDSSYVVAAAALNALKVADSLNIRKYCEAGLLRDSYRDGIRIAALRGLSGIGDEEAFKKIKQYTQYGYERNVRIEALNLIARVWKTKEGVLPFLIGMTNDPSFNVRRSVVEILGTAGDPLALVPLQRIVEENKDERIVKVARTSIDKIKLMQQQGKESH
jgi:aminopeptidase N